MKHIHTFENFNNKEVVQEGQLLNAIRPAFTGDLKDAVEELEIFVMNTGAKIDFKELADILMDIKDAAYQEGWNDCESEME